MTNEATLLDSIYPAVATDVSLHRTPERGIIFQDRLVHEFLGSRSVEFNLPATSTVNSGGLDFLSRCGGVRSAEATVASFVEENGLSREEATDALRKFLGSAVSVGHVEMLPRPKSSPPRVTGSSEFWMPTNGCLELTARCNLRCRHCYRDSGDVEEESLSTDELLSVIERLSTDGVRILELTGGEPLMRRDFETIFEFCASKMSTIALLTNGCLVTPRLARAITAHKRKVVVSVSIDSPAPEFHDRFRGVPGSHRRACETVRRLAEGGVIVRVAMSVVPENASMIRDTLLLARELGALAFGYNPVLPVGRGRDIDWSGMSAAELQTMHRAEAELAREHKDMVTLVDDAFMKNLASYGNCGAGSRSITIDAAGDVRVCQMAQGPFFTLGNLVRNTLREIMATEQARAFRHLPPPSPELCGNCRFVPLCKTCFLRGMMVFSARNRECAWAKHLGLAPLEDGAPSLTQAACSIYTNGCS